MTGTGVRLHGIDAPEGRQTCQRDGATWACGAEAAARLSRLVDGKQVKCTSRDIGRYGRMVATCEAGGVDLAGAMVSSGQAVALPEFSNALDAEVSCAAANCATTYFIPRLQGNRTRKGQRIYHLPGMP